MTGRARPSGWCLAPAVALLLAVATAGTAADARQEEGEEEAVQEIQRALTPEEIEEILAAEEEIFAGEGYAYDPGERRDPFRSLLSPREPIERRGPRPEGVPGLLIDEISVTGIFITPQGAVAQVTAADREMSHLIREGDELYDGDVVRITRNEVVFRQIVPDPTAPRPFRDVVKRLTP